MLNSDDYKTLEFVNKAKPELEIEKVDSDTNERIENTASFELYKGNDCVNYDGILETKNGVATKKLQPGKYSFKEGIAPEGYQLNDSCIDFEIKEDEVVHTITVKDVVKKEINIKKIGSYDGLPVSGVEFKLYSDSKCSKYLDTSVVSDTNGKAIFRNLDDGTYYVQENSVPYGYIKDDTCHAIVAGSDELEIKNQQYFDFTIEKVDSITNDSIEGVEFKLCSDEDCKVSAVHYDNSKIDKTELVTNANGKMVIKGLNPGMYYYQETKVADGYVLSDVINGISIEKDTSIIVKNSKYNLKINKVSSDDLKVNLPGSKINIVQLSSKELLSQSFVSTDKTIDVGVEPGVYAIYEVDAPDGYVPLESGLIFKIDENGKYKKFDGDYSEYEQFIGIPLEAESSNFVINDNSIKIINNRIYVKLSKVDVTSAEEVPGATVVIYDSNNHEVVKFISDDKGPKLFYLDPGEYTLKETVAPKGYKKLTSTFKFTLTEGGAIVTDNKDESYFVNGDTIIIYNGMDTINVPITGLSKDVVVILIGVLLIGGGVGLIFFKKKKSLK